MSDDYPTQQQLEAIEALDGGTPRAFMGLVRSAWNHNMGFVSDERHEQEGWTSFTLVTGGWSGNEDLVAALKRTMFHSMFWHSSDRGGKHVYGIGDAQLEFRLPALNLPREHVAYGVRELDADGTVMWETGYGTLGDAKKPAARTQYAQADVVTRTVTNWKVLNS